MQCYKFLNLGPSFRRDYYRLALKETRKNIRPSQLPIERFSEVLRLNPATPASKNTIELYRLEEVKVVTRLTSVTEPTTSIIKKFQRTQPTSTCKLLQDSTAVKRAKLQQSDL